MSPRAFQTILVAPTMGNKDRLELESKVLAAALKQSFERGDTVGVSLAHRQIFLLLKAQQSADGDFESKEKRNRPPEPAGRSGEPPPATESPPPTSRKRSKKRTMPNIVWTEDEDPPTAVAKSEPPAAEVHVEPAAETVEETAESSDEEEEETPAADEAESTEEAAEASEAAEEPEPVERPTFNAYGILAVDQSATFEDIHRSFLYLVRKVLFNLKKVKRKQRKPLLEHLQDLWIAHDILSDPVTRTDFDFRLLGLRGSPDVLLTSAPPDDRDEAAANSTRTPLRIGELMQCAGLLEQTELEIAADMHKAMPEMLFGAFLVKQGFISEEDLGQVLIGQWLLKNGDMTVNHYQSLMKKWREQHVPIEESAVADGVISQNEMDRLVYSFNQDTQSQVPVLGLGLRQPQINAEEAAKRNLSAGNAVPQWKDQLDWSAPPEPVKRYEERLEERKPMDPTIEIEGITDGAPKEQSSGKKSLRRLMEGIHSPDSSSKDEGSARTLKSILSAAANEPEKMRADQIDMEPPGVPVEPNPNPNLDITGETGIIPVALADVTTETAIVAEPGGDAPPPPVVQEVAPVAEAPGAEAPSPAVETFAPAVEPPVPSRPARKTWDPDAMDESEETSEVAQVELSEVAQAIMFEAGVPESKLHAPDIPAVSTRDVPREFVSGRMPPSRGTPGYSYFEPGEPPFDQSDDFSTQKQDDLSTVFGELNFDEDDEIAADVDYFGYSNEKNAETKQNSPPAPRQQPTRDIVYFEDRHKKIVLPQDVSSTHVPIVSKEEKLTAEDSNETKAPDAVAELGGDEQSVKPIDLVYFQDEEENRRLESKRTAAASSQAPAAAPPEPKTSEETSQPEPAAQETAQRTAADAKREVKNTQDLVRHNRAETTDIVRPFPSNDLDTTGDDMDLSMFKPKIKPVPPPIRADQRGMDASGEFASFRPRSQQPAPKAESTPTAESSSAGSDLSPTSETKSTGDLEQPVVEELSEQSESTEQPAQQLSDQLAKQTDEEPSEETGEQSSQQTEEELSEPPQSSSKITTEVEFDAKRISAEVDDFEAEIRNLDAAIGDVEADMDLAGFGLSDAILNDEDEGDDTDETEAVEVKETPKPVQKREGLKKNDKDKNEQQRLKSGEWQLVYKLEGSIADMFLSDEAEADIPQKLRPRLTEIDTVIPTSISQLAKDDTKSSGAVPSDSSAGDKEKKQDEDEQQSAD